QASPETGMSGAKICAWQSTSGLPLPVVIEWSSERDTIKFPFGSASAARIIIRVEHPAGHVGKVRTGRSEDIDQQVCAGIDCRRRVDHAGRDDADRGTAAALMLVVAPFSLVGGPRPAKVMFVD